MPDTQDELNRDHALNPKLGDYWQDHLCPVAVVVLVTDFYVITIEKKKVADADHWTWDLDSKTHAYTRKEFAFRFTYGYGNTHDFQGHPDPDNIKNKYFADVCPEAHKWIEKELAGCSTAS